MFIDILSWGAIALLSVSYWFQIYKIHVHKEVRDISLTYNILLALGFAILGVTAFQEKSLIFLVKQIMTTIPVIIIIIQVLIHKRDKWHDLMQSDCKQCEKELEAEWHHCPYCGFKNTD